MRVLADKIAREIKESGPISLARYMELCLLDPEHGYYQRLLPIGQSGDFTTAPEISQIFGELIGLWLAQSWLDQGSPPRFSLLELGPGRGTMMADILRATAKIPGFHASCDLILYEKSRTLRDLQEKTLASTPPHWISDLTELPQQPLFFVANEFFDALPINHYVRRFDGRWNIKSIEQNARGLTPTLHPLTAPPFRNLHDEDTENGALVEHSPALPSIIAPLAARIAKHKGTGLVVDYGDWRTLGDTLQAVRNHKYADPFENPGEADLSAHVDFEALAHAASPLVKYTRLTPQGVFLRRLGIDQRTDALAKNLFGAKLDNHLDASDRLTNPNRMGTIFKAFALYPPKAPLPPGFQP